MRGSLMEEAMIQAQATAARIACARMTIPHLSALHDSVERASCLAARSQWDRKAAAHAEIFVLLADVADDPTLAPLLKGGAAYAQELMLAVGRAADGMIVRPCPCPNYRCPIRADTTDGKTHMERDDRYDGDDQRLLAGSACEGNAVGAACRRRGHART